MKHNTMPDYKCLCASVMKDGRLVRRIPMEGPYFRGQHRNELFNFYIEDTEEQFVSFEV